MRIKFEATEQSRQIPQYQNKRFVIIDIKNTVDIMTPIVANRLCAPALQSVQRAAFSTSAPKQMPATATTAAPSFSWRWKNLSPKTRRNIQILGVAGAVTDAYVFINYPDMFKGKQEAQN